MHVVPEAVTCLCQLTVSLVSHLFLFYLGAHPSLVIILAVYNEIDSQQLSTISFKQTSKSLPGTSPPTRVKTTTNRIYAWHFEYANTMPTILCTSNGVICGYVTGIHFCLQTKKRHVMHQMKFAAINPSVLYKYYLIIILYAYYLMIRYVFCHISQLVLIITCIAQP